MDSQILKTAGELFVVGILTSSGPCLLSCSPVILTFIAGSRRNWKEGLSAMLIFLSTRALVYLLLGGAVGFLGNMISSWFTRLDRFIFLSGGLFVSFVGILLFLEKEKSGHCENHISSPFLKEGIQGPVLLALTFSLLPCLPLLAVLAWIAFEAKNVLDGGILGFSFGLGMCVSPLIPLAMAAGHLPVCLIKDPKKSRIFIRICGVILFLSGIRLIFGKMG